MSIKAMSWAWQQKAKGTRKLILMALADHADDDGICWPGKKGLAEKCCVDKRVVVYHIRKLCEMGLLNSTPRHRDDKTQTTNLYSLPMHEMVPPHDDNGGGGCYQYHGGDDTSIMGGVIPVAPLVVLEPSLEPPLEPLLSKPSVSTCPYREIVKAWNERATSLGLAAIRGLSDGRKRKLAARWKEWPDGLETFAALLTAIGESAFLRGQGGKEWRATFDWLVKNDENWQKVLEGQYDGKGEEAIPRPPTRFGPYWDDENRRYFQDSNGKREYAET